MRPHQLTDRFKTFERDVPLLHQQRSLFLYWSTRSGPGFKLGGCWTPHSGSSRTNHRSLFGVPKCRIVTVKITLNSKKKKPP